MEVCPHLRPFVGYCPLRGGNFTTAHPIAAYGLRTQMCIKYTDGAISPRHQYLNLPLDGSARTAYDTNDARPRSRSDTII